MKIIAVVGILFIFSSFAHAESTKLSIRGADAATFKRAFKNISGERIETTPNGWNKITGINSINGAFSASCAEQFQSGITVGYFCDFQFDQSKSDAQTTTVISKTAYEGLIVAIFQYADRAMMQKALRSDMGAGVIETSERVNVRKFSNGVESEFPRIRIDCPEESSQDCQLVGVLK